MKERLKTLTILLLIICMALTYMVSSEQEKKPLPKMEAPKYELGYFESMIMMLNDKYYKPVYGKKLTEGALKGMFSSLDPYSTFYSDTEMGDVIEKQEGSYSGIGVEMVQQGKNLIITKVFDDSPAAKAGVKPGDKLIRVDGKNIEAKSLDDVVGMTKGPEGTKVKIAVLRGTGKDAVNLEITRGQIKVKTVYYTIEGKIAYIRISMFNAHTGEQFSSVLNEINQKKFEQLIIDLRDNPGGDVSQAVEVAQKIIPKGSITKIKYKYKKYGDKEYTSNLEKSNYTIIALVNENTASSAEILAGAIQDRKAGTLVGTKTFGKAKVQKMLPILTPEAYLKYKKKYQKNLVDGYELHELYGIQIMSNEAIGMAAVTAGEYLTPNGRNIDEVGITPDVIVENSKEKDKQYEKAVELLTK